MTDTPEQKSLVQHERLTLEHYDGPIPPVIFVSDWDRLLPGAADRILKMTEAEGDHRRLMERGEQEMVSRHHKRDIMLKILGQLFAFLFLLLLTGGGFYLIAIDKDATGIVSILGAAGSIVGMFIYGKKAATVSGEP